MISMSSLWLPIVLSPVLVFIASSVIHMATPWHKKEYPAVPDEEKLRNALQPLALPAGDYMVPRCTSMAEMKSPEFAAKMTSGPVLILTVMPNAIINMGKTLGRWFLYTLVVTLSAAHVAAISLPAGAHHALVFHVVWETAFAGYALGLWQMSIWYSRSWSTTLRATVDGLLYALITGGVFVWAWPQ